MNTESLFEQAALPRPDNNLKWAKYRGRDILPMWVADMDFHSPQAVIDALQSTAAMGALGYCVRPEELNAITAAWIQKQHGWQIQPEWLVWLPGLVSALNAACRGLVTSEQDIVSFTPIYSPFLSAPEYSQRHLIRCPMVQSGGHYVMDIERFESLLTENTRLLLLCSPHNPAGRVWQQQELSDLMAVCERKNITVCSDEIHCDLVLEPGCRHIPTASISEDAQNRTVTLMAASKTFNVAGLNCAFAIIPNPQLRQAFRKATFGIMPHVNLLGYAATMAAFRDGTPWHSELITALRKNRNTLYSAIEKMPGLHMNKPQATYLGWIDCRGANLKDPVSFFEDAGVGLSDGAEFDGPGFVRMNYGCTHQTLQLALQRMLEAFSKSQA